MIYNDVAAHGYFILNVTKKQISISYKFNEDILLRGSKERQGPDFIIDNSNKLKKNV